MILWFYTRPLIYRKSLRAWIFHLKKKRRTRFIINTHAHTHTLVHRDEFLINTTLCVSPHTRLLTQSRPNTVFTINIHHPFFLSSNFYFSITRSFPFVLPFYLPFTTVQPLFLSFSSLLFTSILFFCSYLNLFFFLVLSFFHLTFISFTLQFSSLFFFPLSSISSFLSSP